MRKIKFRAWNEDTQKIIDLKELTDLALAIALRQDGLFIPFSKKYKIMQFTGLRDKNGVDIYEGDILRILYTDGPSNPAPNNEGLDEYKKSISNVGTVEFRGYGWKVYGKYLDGIDHGSLFDGVHGEKEIIGNIFENPELLETHT